MIVRRLRKATGSTYSDRRAGTGQMRLRRRTSSVPTSDTWIAAICQRIPIDMPPARVGGWCFVLDVGCGARVQFGSSGARTPWTSSRLTYLRVASLAEKSGLIPGRRLGTDAV